MNGRAIHTRVDGWYIDHWRDSKPIVWKDGYVHTPKWKPVWRWTK